ncbi:hypothetical protein [Mesorhizobium sp. B1-1-8]|uniref:hypothetical protein n=1 Tax=Mesorhizobium sp. B1-1-8 TaxID=2589976 RepID=UPI00112A7B53|nr:hypothetical protein [Mesorhizobium sp. B1-1-8]UCI05671.1 hypothetical protein FJ974_17705 [Mesorhizobium sp. B1-1-8]
MADSDNSTTLPSVIRRELFRATTDPAVTVWREWQAAHEETDRLSREQQRLERRLVEEVGFPKVMIRLSDDRGATPASHEALRGVLGVGSMETEIAAKVEADLAVHQARWEAYDRAIGYSATLRAESEAAGQAETLLEALSETPAISLAGVAAKLDAILREGQPSKDDPEFPWPQIRSVMEDIGRIGVDKEPS